MAASIFSFFCAASSTTGATVGVLAASAAASAALAFSAMARSSATWACSSGVSWAASCFSAFFSATWAMLASIFRRLSSSGAVPTAFSALTRSMADCGASAVTA
ncbi:hypothetical protein D9M71_137650 [compost metagenome]